MKIRVKSFIEKCNNYQGKP